MVFAFSAAVAGALIWIPHVIAPRRLSPVKEQPFECGKDPIEVAEGRFAIRFSTIAIFFILIDIELIFVWPWAVLYRRLGWFGFAHVESGPLVRSSYHAKKQTETLEIRGRSGGPLRPE